MRLLVILGFLVIAQVIESAAASYLPERSTLIKVYNAEVKVEDDSILTLSYSLLANSDDNYAHALSHFHIGFIKNKKHDLRAAAHYIETIHLLEEADTTDIFLDMAVRKNLGVIYKQHGDLESGIRYYQEAIPYAAAYDKTRPYNKQTNVMSLKYNLANAYSENYNPKAIDIYLSILEEAKSKEIVYKIAQINNQLGILFNNAKEYDLAIEHYNNVLNCKYGLPDDNLKLIIGFANENLGEVYFKRAEMQLAEKYCLEALEYFEDEDKFGPLVTLTELNLYQNKKDLARKYGEWALKIFPQVQKSEEKLKIFELMADLTTTEEDQPNEYLTRMLVEQRSVNQDLNTLADLKDKENLYRVVDSYYRELEANQRSAEYREWIVTGCAILITLIVLMAGYFMIMDKRKKKELVEGLSKDGSDFKYY